MRPSSLISRGFPANPRMLCRAGSRPIPFASAVRLTSSTSRRGENDQKSSHNSSSSSSAGNSANSWSLGRMAVVASLAAGIGYGIGNSDQLLEPKDAGTPRYGTAKDFEKAIAELQVKLGEDAISTDEDDLQRHGFSEWSSVNAQRLPVAIAYPSSTEDVSEIAKICNKYKMPMVPYSGGSSLEANFSAAYGGLTIDFAYMNKILDLHEADMDVVVQPSIQWMDLNEKIKDTGLFFPVDPGPSAMIGGSEGTLGIVTEATLKLAPIPEETRVGVVSFPTIRDAASTAMQLVRKGVPVQCMEILDDVQMDVINKAGGTGRTWKTLPTLFFKFSGTKAGVADSINLTRNLAKANKAEAFEFAKNDAEAHDLWSARKQSLWSMMALRPEGSEVWSTDVAVPISRLPDIIELEISKKELDDLGIFASILGHIGDGNFHSSIMYDPKNADERQRVEKVVHDMVDRALEMEGSCTVTICVFPTLGHERLTPLQGEHGVGLGKKSSLKKELGPNTIGAMRNIKKAFDPHWLLNPGKIFDPQG
ncbi:hypothetical protein AN4792.2 [Aspergillus nidulans FGSC A4]|uniref:D-lactate dehydrogenase (cytochrome) n=1 Tax=Emericella nidulans (strain FGSC A4 / ATCC 38163 / CBS 112.46 / NRRL 194 / M139) TaxID=227321 RepID=Q5B3T8_EMENI|nr:hypothetical protein [Aspergillus nidulans FGSC A4]EAA60362.1 hypothetical protein AN4792.2 [Aspergillus nidulans FGSC A4]CBF76772.1 TPA: conserved hypothetical protein [Aspergillus nidulans FGSC A4]|eukprot:XP_662396.1 hypothetical protein AN4792.2 [Aspergillus nidulans FGSC A4]